MSILPVGTTHVQEATEVGVAHAQRFAELTASIGAALQGVVVVNHNASFDAAFQRTQFARAAMPMLVFFDLVHVAGQHAVPPSAAAAEARELLPGRVVQQAGPGEAEGRNGGTMTELGRAERKAL